MNPQKIFLLFSCLCCSFCGRAQNPGNVFDTVYYDYHMVKVKKKYARYFRTPAQKKDDRYIYSFYHLNGTPMYTVSKKAGVVDYHLSLEDDVAFKDGPIIAYNVDYVSMTGTYKMDKPVGTWKFFYRGGEKVSRLHVYDDESTGYERVDYDMTGRKKLAGSYKRTYEMLLNKVWLKSRDDAFRKNGPWIYYWRDTQKLHKVLTYRSNELEGPCAYYSGKTFKKILQGQYTKRRRTGTWEYTDEVTGKLVGVMNYDNDGYLDGDVFMFDEQTGDTTGTGSYKLGYRSGEWRLYYPGSRKTKVLVQFQKDQGAYSEFDSLTGELTKTGFVKGMEREGKWIFYFPGSKKVSSVVYYHDGQRLGHYAEYDSLGYLTVKGEFSEGEKHGRWTYYCDFSDKVWFESNYQRDTIDGTMTLYYRNGAKKRERQFRKGKLIADKCFELTGREEQCGEISTDARFQEDIMTYIGNNMRYPEDARDGGIEGKVLVSFMVDTDGSVKDVNVAKGADNSLNEEAVRVIESMPNWIPAEIDGKTIRSYKTVPILFWLPQEAEPEIGVIPK